MLVGTVWITTAYCPKRKQSHYLQVFALGLSSIFVTGQCTKAEFGSGTYSAQVPTMDTGRIV